MRVRSTQRTLDLPDIRMKTAAALLVLILLSACATGPTPYQPRAKVGAHGFSDQALESDRVRITFNGNSSTPRETVENYLLYRAAEVTVERGFRYFVPIQQDVEREEQSSRVATGIGAGFGRGWWNGRYYGSVVIVDSAATNERDSYRASAIFKLIKDEPANENMDVFDAQEIFKFLGPNIVRPSETPE